MKWVFKTFETTVKAFKIGTFATKTKQDTGLKHYIIYKIILTGGGIRMLNYYIIETLNNQWHLHFFQSFLE